MDQDQAQIMPATSAEVKEEKKDEKKVVTISTPTNVSSVMDEIERITKEIEELQIRNLGSDDPEYLEKAKKLMQIRKFLTKKTRPVTPSKLNLWTKIKDLRHRHGHVRPSEMEPTPSEMMAISDHAGSSNFSNYSVDDAFMYGAECMLTLLDMIKNKIDH